MNMSRIANVLLAPHVTEKAAVVGDAANQYVFRVARDANKLEIKKAVETMFDVKVASVSTALMKGKVKRFGATMGKRKDWKKAYVRLQAGQEIDLQGGE